MNNFIVPQIICIYTQEACLLEQIHHEKLRHLNYIFKRKCSMHFPGVFAQKKLNLVLGPCELDKTTLGCIYLFSDEAQFSLQNYL